MHDDRVLLEARLDCFVHERPAGTAPSLRPFQLLALRFAHAEVTR